MLGWQWTSGGLDVGRLIVVECWEGPCGTLEFRMDVSLKGHEKTDAFIYCYSALSDKHAEIF